jgi:trehalose/maltose hydrolase-like predicted phosphorylase
MPSWTLAYDSFDPLQERLREVLTSTGNGYFCTRGAAEWADVDEIHYPGTYAHGCYNRETSILGGRPVLNEDLVNLPNWLVLKLRIEDGEPVGLSNVELLSYRQELDVRTAMLTRTVRFRDPASRETTLVSRRFVSMAETHQAALEWTITAENWSGEVTVLTALDGRVTNQGVARYRQLEGRHLHPYGSRSPRPDTISLVARTRQSHIYIAEAARTRVCGERGTVDVTSALYQMEDYVHQALTFRLEERAPVRLEKMVALYTSRDRAINEPRSAAERAVRRYGTFAEAFERHGQAWDELWQQCRETNGSSSCFASTSATSSRSARRTRSGSTPASPPAASTGRPTAVTSSGTSSTSTRSSTSGCPRSRASCSCTATGVWARRGRWPGRPATGEPCTHGRAAATGARRPRSSTSILTRDAGSPTSAGTSAT